MKFDIARQSLIPAVLTLFALAVTSVCYVNPSVASAAPQALLTPSIGALLIQFQNTYPLWSGLLAGLAILFGGMCTGRIAIRYNLYTVGSCLPIPLFAVIACGIGTKVEYLAAFIAAALLALTIKNFCRSFCNGYGFDPIFRATLYLSCLVLIQPAALPLLLMLPLAIILFRRTVREMIVALTGLLLPPLLFCYVYWGLGGEFLAPMVSLSQDFLHGTPLVLFTQMQLQAQLLLGSIALLSLFALLFFLSNIYTAGTKPRLILIYNIGVLILSALLLCGPAATESSFVFLAVPSAIMLPVLFIRINRRLALLLYLLLLATAFLNCILQ